MERRKQNGKKDRQQKEWTRKIKKAKKQNEGKTPNLK